MGYYEEQVLTFIAFNRIFGFLLGSTLAGASVYYYILAEYKVSNELLTEDIYVGDTYDFALAVWISPLVQHSL